MKTLDRLSRGRAILGVGLGTPIDAEYGTFGEPTDQRILAERLDEGLEIVDGLLSGKPVHHAGAHYRVDGAVFLPRPVQLPRVVLPGRPDDPAGLVEAGATWVLVTGWLDDLPRVIAAGQPI